VATKSLQSSQETHIKIFQKAQYIKSTNPPWQEKYFQVKPYLGERQVQNSQAMEFAG
jgi:hypothetical protein